MEESSAVSSSESSPNKKSNSIKKKNSTKKKEPSDGRPKRPLSAYNLFFQAERERILRYAPERPEGKPRRSHGKIGFAALARAIAERWKNIEAWERKMYDSKAAQEKLRYTTEMEHWKKRPPSPASLGTVKHPNKSNADDDSKEDQDRKPKATSSSSGRIKVVPPPIAPRRLPSPHLDMIGPMQPRSRSSFGLAGNSPQLDGSIFPSSQSHQPMIIWPHVGVDQQSSTVSEVANRQQQPQQRIAELGQSQNVAISEITLPSRKNLPELRPRDSHHQRNHYQQALLQLNRAISDSSLIRLANALDNESIDFFSELFHQDDITGQNSNDNDSPSSRRSKI